MQHQLTKGPLLDEKGNLLEAGFAFDLVKQYDRKAIKGLKSRIKEWDYYYIGDKEYGVALTIDDKPEAKFALVDGDKPVAVYAYCNLHGLWVTEL